MKIVYLLLFFPIILYSQITQKKLTTKRIEVPPVIDGILDDEVWRDCSVASDFIMVRPENGKRESERYKSKVKVVYDDTSLYIAAYLFDSDPSSIPRQFATRDSEANADFFEVKINPFKDKQNDTVFFVSSAGTQADCKISGGHEDFSWNAVWESEVVINDEGWFVEMKIPFSALRFSKSDKLDWDINFLRSIRSEREEYSWNFIDKENGRESEYPGLLMGLNDIEPPIRLSFYPFTQGTLSSYKKDVEWRGTAGLDVKYGINESFTLDATLVPDFGQTAFDDLVLNLGPFETQYEEKRAFFTEGTELFRKGNLFYSRRVGGQPIYYGQVASSIETDDSLVSNPEKNRILNAIKLSGRTSNGLGIGVFNAVTQETSARIRQADGSERLFLTNPLTNYSVLVLDQSLPRGSSVSFVNSTVVRRGGENVDANVSSALLNYRTKNNKYVFISDLSMSNKFSDSQKSTSIESGYKAKIKIKEVVGSHRFGGGLELTDSKYDKNDLGYQSYGNYLLYDVYHSYRTFQPKGIYNSIYIKNYVKLEYMQSPYVYTDNALGSFLRFITRKHLSYGGQFEAHFGNRYDYYEPHLAGRFYKEQQKQNIGVWLSTDYRKKVAVDIGFHNAFQLSKDSPNSSFSFSFNPRYRINDKAQLIFNYSYSLTQNEKGYITNDDETSQVYFGNREKSIIETGVQSTYNHSVKSSFSLAFRHYWARVDYDEQFFLLEENGELSATNDVIEWMDYNSNFFNLDMNYTWQFAPGSQMVVLYRSTIISNDEFVDLSFLRNIQDLVQKSAKNEISVKLIYYLDYNRAR